MIAVDSCHLKQLFVMFLTVTAGIVFR